MIVDNMLHQYSQTSDINKKPIEDTILISKLAIDGSDVGIGSLWTVKSTTNGKFTLHPVDGKQEFKITYTEKQLLNKFKVR